MAISTNGKATQLLRQTPQGLLVKISQKLHADDRRVVSI